MADENNTGWKVYRPEWYNDRVMETYISAPIVDKQNDMIPTETIKEAMDFYMRYGVYSYRHEEMPIGLPLAYKIKNGKVKIRVGIHNKIAMHDKVWKEIGDYGPSGASSIRGEATDQEKVCLSENDCHNRINELSLWSISWVGDNPANPEAKVTDVAMAKSKSVQVTLDEVESMVEKIIERKNGQYCLYAKKNRKLLGCHDTKAGAIRQERAIQARRFGKSDTLNEILTKIEKYKIPKGVKNEAITGRELRKKHGYGGGKVTKAINNHLINKEYVTYKMAMAIHKYYRRHEKVDPQGKNFNNKKRPSKGLIMWKMMGGDAGHSWSKSLETKVKSLDKAECSCTIKTERLQKTNNYLDDIMRMIKFGTFIEKKPENDDDDKKKPERGGGAGPSGTWMENCKINARKISNDYTEFTGNRRRIRNHAAWCAELWHNPGKYSQTYHKPDGSKGRTDGYKLRRKIGLSNFKLDNPKPSK